MAAAAYSKVRRLLILVVMALILLAITTAPVMAQNVNVKANIRVTAINTQIEVTNNRILIDVS